MALTARQKKQLAIGGAVVVGIIAVTAFASAKPKAPADEGLDDDGLDDDEGDDEGDLDVDLDIPEEVPEPDDVLADIPEEVRERGEDILEDLPIPDEVRERLPAPPKKKKPKKKPEPRKEAPPVVDVSPPQVEVPDVPGVVETPDVIQAPTPNADAVTLDMVRTLLAAEEAPGWKQVLGVVRQYQSAKGLVVDGKYGPKTALRVAIDVGTIPIVRFWPTAAGANPQAAVDSYRDGLLEIARNASGAHAQLLRASAARETGQGFGPPQGSNGKIPITPTFQLGASGGATFGTA